MTFLNSSIQTKIVILDPKTNQELFTNHFTTELNNTTVSVNKRFKIGMKLIRAQMRDSMKAWSIDWGLVYAAYKLVQKKGHSLSLSVGAMMRTNFKYESAGGGTSHQLWLPIKLQYSYAWKKFKVYTSASFIPVQNLQAGYVNLFAFAAGASYTVTKKTDPLQIDLFLDASFYFKKATGAPMEMYRQTALTKVISGLRIRFNGL